MAEEFESLGLDSVDVAQKIRYIAQTEFGLLLNMTQTQKLLYIAYGIEMARADMRLTDEHPQAWPFGPVFPRVHSKVDFSTTPPNPTGISEEIIGLLSDVVKAFGRTSAAKLSEWSHSKDSPWDKTPKDKWGHPLSDCDIREYFSGLKCARSEK